MKSFIRNNVGQTTQFKLIKLHRLPWNGLASKAREKMNSDLGIFKRTVNSQTGTCIYQIGELLSLIQYV